ncbi:zinc transporter ZIP3-like [Tetranychus urticae]|uniref:zinc transporter ZIP3-like n=1 Tax=Tetranychus urticae TaxID=32264 RepID=UPI00077BC0E2|nr:zinc transporter ZIP3-like [Tetranychus urticae]
MTLIGARLASLFALFGVTMLAGLGPVLVFRLWQRKRERFLSFDSEPFGNETNYRVSHQSNRSAKILQLLLVFGGGVLLSTCFVHMIPEIQENYESYMKNKDSSGSRSATLMSIENDFSDNNLSQFIEDSYEDEKLNDQKSGESHKIPWVEICICAGLFLTYFIEEFILFLIGNSSNHNHHHHHHHHENQRYPNSKEIGDCLPKREDLDYGTMIRPILSRNSNYSSESRRSSIKSGYDNVAVDARDDELSSIRKNSDYQGASTNGLWVRFLRGLIIVAAFLAHSIFDGIAIGLQTTAHSIWTLFFAICLHKLVVVFAIGFELFEKTGSLFLTTIHITIFSSMSPLGIALTIFTEQSLAEDGSLTLILLNAVATGAILYIVFLEILQSDRCPELNGFTQLAALVSGFVLMTFMTIVFDDGD